MKTKAIRQILVGLALVGWLVAFTGCTTRYIRDAQDSWNQGSMIENRLFEEGVSASNGLSGQAAAVTEYRLALALVNRELDKNAGKLRVDRLYGSAMMLKAMCLWRLSDLEQISEGANDKVPTSQLVEELGDPDKSAGGKGGSDSGPGVSRNRQLAETIVAIQSEFGKKKGTFTLGERDQVMLVALPGLRDHDRGLAATDLAMATSFFESSIKTLDRALAREEALRSGDASRVHPVRTYLYFAQLSTCRAWQSAIYRAKEKQEPALSLTKILGSPELVPVRAKAKAILDELESRAGSKDEALKKGIDEFKKRLGTS